MKKKLKTVRGFFENNYPLRIIVLYSLLGTFLFFVLGIWVLSKGHPHEDAYILFKYVKNIIGGYGIVYNPGGEPTEGVTDFLWMILISGLSYTGIDIAVSAIILNSLGFFTISFVTLRNYFQKKIHIQEIIVGFLFVLVLEISQLSQASLGGFSTLFFAAFVVLIFDIYFNIQYKYYFLIPVYGILLALTRPEGLIISFLFTAFAYYDISRSKESVKFTYYLLGAALTGIIYFVWRYQYFGELLPLPFYVKTSGGDGFLGTESLINWVKESKFLIFISLLLVPLLKKNQVQYYKASFPLLIFLFFLMFFEPTQNVAFRYEAPAIVVMLYIIPVFVKEFFQSSKRKINLILSFAVILFISAPFLRQFNKEIKNITKIDYINYLPALIEKNKMYFNEIALTESGRIAYWTNIPITDIVGLNNKQIAQTKPDISYLEKKSPDLIFIHTANTLHKIDTAVSYFETDINSVENYIKPYFARILENDAIKVEQAALATYTYLKKHKYNYRIFFAKYGEGYNHMFAVKDDTTGRAGIFEECLKKSFLNENVKSYFEMKKLNN